MLLLWLKFHSRSKYTEFDVHFVSSEWRNKFTRSTPTKHLVANIFKDLRSKPLMLPLFRGPVLQETEDPALEL